MIDADYKIIIVNNKRDLNKILNDLKKYIVEKTKHTEIDIQHNLYNFKTYICIKKDYLKIIDRYLEKEKIQVKNVCSKSRIISTYIQKKIDEDNLKKYGFILDKNYYERLKVDDERKNVSRKAYIFQKALKSFEIIGRIAEIKIDNNITNYKIEFQKNADINELKIHLKEISKEIGSELFLVRNDNNIIYCQTIETEKNGSSNNGIKRYR